MRSYIAIATLLLAASCGSISSTADGGTGGVYRGGTGTAMVPISATPDRAVTVSRGGFGESAGSRGAGG